MAAATCFAGSPSTEQQAVDVARTKLRDRVLATEVQRGVKVEDVLRRSGQLPEFDKEIGAIRPVGGARWIGDRGCQVRLEMPGEQVSSLLRKAGEYQTTQPTTEESDRFKRIEQTLYVSEASSFVSGQNRETTGGERRLVPPQPPEWVNRSLEAQAWVRSNGSPLLTSQAAEEKARDILRARIGMLTLGNQTTVDQAAKTEPDIASALNRAMDLARVRRTEYGADGSATVKVEINLQYVWDELNR